MIRHDRFWYIFASQRQNSSEFTSKGCECVWWNFVTYFISILLIVRFDYNLRPTASHFTSLCRMTLTEIWKLIMQCSAIDAENSPGITHHRNAYFRCALSRIVTILGQDRAPFQPFGLWPLSAAFVTDRNHSHEANSLNLRILSTC